VDEEARQLILLLDRRQAERDHRFKEWLDEFVADSVRRHEEVMGELKSRHEEVMAEITSHRKALFSILDRLDSGGGAAPA
jgi:hypothetical protein